MKTVGPGNVIQLVVILGSAITRGCVHAIPQGGDRTAVREEGSSSRNTWGTGPQTDLEDPSPQQPWHRPMVRTHLEQQPPPTGLNPATAMCHWWEPLRPRTLPPRAEEDKPILTRGYWMKARERTLLSRDPVRDPTPESHASLPTWISKLHEKRWTHCGRPAETSKILAGSIRLAELYMPILTVEYFVALYISMLISSWVHYLRDIQAGLLLARMLPDN